jgi:4-aminobutyrate aminotransferase/(S)-3-amino-2-methylpropionate transaminase
MPLAAVTGRAEIMDSAHLGGIGGTYGGSPVACAAAIEAVNIIRQPAFLAHARHLGEVMRDEMEGWKSRWPIVGDVRGLGPMMLAEFVTDRKTKTPASPDSTLKIVRGAVANGVVVMRAGLYSNGVRLLPPLTMPEDMLREGLNALAHAIERVAVDSVAVSV